MTEVQRWYTWDEMCINKMGLEGEVHDLKSISKESEFYSVDSGKPS